MFALYEGGSKQPATSEDVAIYAQQLGITQFPVLADGVGAFKSVTPMTQLKHPEMCAITPDMRIISCASGHTSHFQLMNDIRAHIAGN